MQAAGGRVPRARECARDSMHASSVPSGSWQEVGDLDRGVGARQRCDGVAGGVARDGRVPVGSRVAVDLKRSIGDGDDPVLADAAACVEPLLDRPVPLERFVGDLDDEQRRRRVDVLVVPDGAADDSDVGFGLGVVAGGERVLYPCCSRR